MNPNTATQKNDPDQAFVSPDPTLEKLEFRIQMSRQRSGSNQAYSRIQTDPDQTEIELESRIRMSRHDLGPGPRDNAWDML